MWLKSRGTLAMFRHLFAEAVTPLEPETEQIECHAVLSSIQHSLRLTERMCLSDLIACSRLFSPNNIYLNKP